MGFEGGGRFGGFGCEEFEIWEGGFSVPVVLTGEGVVVEGLVACVGGKGAWN